MLAKLLEVLFPDRCVGCGARGALLCSVCEKRIPPAPAPEYDFVTSLFAYQEARVKKLIKMLKFKNGRRVAKIFAPHLGAALTEFVGEENLFMGVGEILLVPIPLSKKRRRARGYNQAELLVKETIRNLPEGKFRMETKLLKKEIETTPQANIRKRGERLANIGDCFSVLQNNLENGRTIILIDDVTTTGATLKAARNKLRAAGFKKVFAFTVAH